MTPALRKALGQLVHAREPVEPATRRTVGRLVAEGFAVVRGQGFEVTDAGRKAHHVNVIEAETRASSALGNANAAREGGRHSAAERYGAMAQVWLDEANDLRGQGSV